MAYCLFVNTFLLIYKVGMAVYNLPQQSGRLQITSHFTQYLGQCSFDYEFYQANEL